MSITASALAQTQFAEVAGTRLAYRTFGQTTGTPLLLCHRFRGTMDHWDPALLDVLARERQVIIFDNSGVGASSGEGGTSIAAMADVAAKFVRALGLSHVDVLGWSLGGAVSQQLCLDQPGLVRRAVFAGTGPGGVAEAPKAPEKVWQVALKPINDDEDFLYLFFTEDAGSRAAGQASLRRLDARLAIWKAAVKAETVKAQFAALMAWAQGHGSALPRLGEISIPVLVANGTDDVMIHAYNSYVISQRAPNAQLTLYPKSGHAFLFQHAEQFGRHVLEFLN